MAKLILFNMVSADGFFEGKNRELNWHTVDQEFNAFSITQLDAAETLVFGRVTYELMASYWQTEHAKTTDPVVAGKMNSMTKVVFSKTLTAAHWHNIVLHHGNLQHVMSGLRAGGKKNILVLGSGTVASALATFGLVDEYRFMVSPVLLGQGRSLFEGVPDRVSLKLVETRAFASGNIFVRYLPKAV